jgi:hypothetical protein
MNSSLAQLRSQGYVVLHDVLSDGEVELIRDQMAPLLASAPFGRNDFEACGPNASTRYSRRRRQLPFWQRIPIWRRC